MRFAYRLAIIAIFLAACITPARAAREIAVMVTVEGVSLRQLVGWRLPAYSRLIASGAIGLMNNKTDGYQSVENNSVTIGAGTHALGMVTSGAARQQFWVSTLGVPLGGINTNYAQQAYNAGEIIDRETAGQLFTRHTGVTAPDNSIVHTAITPLQRLNTIQHYTIKPGLLGQQLTDNGVGTAVYGNSDAGHVKARNSVAIVMNMEGWVAHGDVGERTLLADPARPFGARTDYAYIMRQVQNLPAGRHFVVIEAGDNHRLAANGTYLPTERYLEQQKLAARECGEFLLRLNEYLRDSTDRYLLCWMVVEQENSAAARGDLLTPVLLDGDGVPSGLLTSQTTRRPGLIANIDLAPGILRFFGITPDATMLGSALYGVAHPHALEALSSMNERIVFTYLARPSIMIGYVVFVGFCVIWAIAMMFMRYYRIRCLPWAFRPTLVKTALVGHLLFGVVQLGAAALDIYRTLPVVIFIIGIAAIAAHALVRLVRDLRILFAIVGLLAMSAICLDLLNGSLLLKRAIISYDPIAGIRFYGIGNEACGMLIGATLLGLFSMLDRWRQRRGFLLPLAVLACIAVFVLIGSPRYGTNFGGMLAALAGFAVALMKIHGNIFRARVLLPAIVVALLSIGGMLALNMGQDAGSQTHIGRGFSQAFASGPGYMGDLIARKWSMNMRLMRSSIWTYALISLLVSLLIILYRPVGIVQQTMRDHPFLNAGLLGILASMFVGLLVNDSGVSMAATGLLFLTAPMLLMVMEKMSAQPPASECLNPSAPLPQE